MGNLQVFPRLLFFLTAMGVSVAAAGPQEDTERADEIYVTTGDLSETLILLRKAAEQGYVPAQVRLGYILDKAEMDEEAVKWYRKAAEQGNAAGEYGLGYMYALGEGVAKDEEQARPWIMRAAEKGHLPAVNMLKEAYKTGGLGLTPDSEKCLFWGDRAREIMDMQLFDSKDEKMGIGETR